MSVKILGIRHHGVGSAKMVRQELTALRPDLILVEGPPEITAMLGLVGHEALKPPLSIMVFDPSNPKMSIFYPFASFSPEWVAACYANEHKIPLRAIDLPASTSFQLKTTPSSQTMVTGTPLKDPLSYLAEIAGYDNSEAWWDHFFERQTQQAPSTHFEAIELAMSALRTENIGSALDQENILREAYMRNCIRAGLNEMYLNIVVVCGAWHAPALIDLDGTYKLDQKILKALPKSKIKIACTWIPWTNERLSMQSGYGAGIQSPGWYGHVWENEHDVEVKWLTKVASIFREKKIDISSAHVIESYRLAKNLAILREKPNIGLEELNEAVVTVMCMGDVILLQYIAQILTIGHVIGKVPQEIPKVPLQADFEQQLKTLRIPLTEQQKDYKLDLRKEIDLSRSIFFQRLNILEIGLCKAVQVRGKGTFKETWSVRYSPEIMIALIDKAYLGNTILDAALANVQQQSREAKQIRMLLPLIQSVLFADLGPAVENVLAKIQELAALSEDTVDLMNAFGPLVELQRYGDIRKSELSVLETIVNQLFVKIILGLEQSCFGLNEEKAYQLFELIGKVNDAVHLMQRADLLQDWHITITKLLKNETIHKIISGCVCRLAFDAQLLQPEESQRQFNFALSPNQPPLDVAQWLEGFLRKSGLILLYDDQLWNLLYEWVETLEQEVFMQQLPFLRRTFAKFEFGERKKIGEKARQGKINSQDDKLEPTDARYNEDRARKMLAQINVLVMRSKT